MRHLNPNKAGLPPRALARKPAGEAPAALAVGLEVHGDHLAAHPAGLLRSLAEDEDRPVDLGPGQRERLPRLRREEAGQGLPALRHAGGDPVEHGGPGVGRQRGLRQAPAATAASRAAATSSDPASSARPIRSPE